MRSTGPVGLGREAENPGVSYPMRLNNSGSKGLEHSWKAAGLRPMLKGRRNNNSGKETLSNKKQGWAAGLTGFPQIP